MFTYAHPFGLISESGHFSNPSMPSAPFHKENKTEVWRVHRHARRFNTYFCICPYPHCVLCMYTSSYPSYSDSPILRDLGNGCGLCNYFYSISNTTRSLKSSGPMHVFGSVYNSKFVTRIDPKGFGSCNRPCLDYIKCIYKSLTLL